MKFCKLCYSLLILNKCVKCERVPLNRKNLDIKVEVKKKEPVKTFIMKKEKTSIERCRGFECKSKEAFITKHQLRAGDEGETLIFTCYVCKKTWRS